MGVACVALSAASFGVMSIFAVYAYEAGASVSTLLFLRFFLAASVFFGLLFWQRQSLRVGKKQLLGLFLLGGVLYTMQSLCFFSSVQYIPTSLAGLLLYTFPVYVAILSRIVDKEALRAKTVAAMLVSLAGLGLVLGRSFAEVSPYGLMLALAAALFYSFYIVVGNRVSKGLSTYATSGYISLFASVSFFFLAQAEGGLAFSFGVTGWWALAGIVLISTVIAISFFIRGLQLIGSTKTSVVSTLEPVVTILFSAVLFAEKLSVMQMLGACAVLTGAVLIVSSKQEAPVRQKEHPPVA